MLPDFEYEQSHNDMPAIQQQFNFHYPTSGSSRQQPGQRGANAEILAPVCIIHFGDVGVGQGWRIGLFPPPPETCFENPRDQWTRRSRQPRQSPSRGHFARRGCGRQRRAAVLLSPGVLGPPGTGPPAPAPTLAGPDLVRAWAEAPSPGALLLTAAPSLVFSP